MIILLMFFGLFAIVYASPAADVLAFLTAITAIYLELKKMPDEDFEESGNVALD